MLHSYINNFSIVRKQQAKVSKSKFFRNIYTQDRVKILANQNPA